MEKKIFYGVDISKNVTPQMARDAIIQCFKEAHKEILNDINGYYSGNEKEAEEVKAISVKMLVNDKFKEVGGDFENPKREDLFPVCKKLAEYASNFRDPKVINKHIKEIKEIINRVD